MIRRLGALLIAAAMLGIAGVSPVAARTFVSLQEPILLPAGTTQRTVNVPANLRGLYFYGEVLQNTASPSTAIQFYVEFSTDNGATWQFGGGATTTGGQFYERDGVTPAYPRFTGITPTGNQVRARFTAVLSQADTVGLRITVDPLNP